MNVLLITPKFPPQTGGAATYFQTLYDSCQSHPAIDDVFVLTEYFAGETIVDDNHADVFRLLPPRTSTTPSKTLRKTAFLGLFGLETLVGIPGLIELLDIDLVHVHSYFTRIGGEYENHLVTQYLPRANARFVLDVRDQFSIPTRPNGFDVTICASRNIYSKANSRTAVGPAIHIPIPMPELQPALDERWRTKLQQLAPYYCFVGDINEKKGVFELAEAFSSLRDEPAFSDHSLVYIGTNNGDSAFTTLVDGEPSIHYLGRQPHSLTMGIVREAEALLLPSRSEGMPRVCLEALTLNTPCIAPPGIPEFEDALPDLTLPEISPTSIARALRKLEKMQTPPDYPLERHDPESIGRQTIELYRRVLDEPNEVL